MTYGYTNRNHRGENHVFSFIIYHSLTVSSWVSKQPHWAVMRTACCHCAPGCRSPMVHGACASVRAGVRHTSRCRVKEASPRLAPLPLGPHGLATSTRGPAGCGHVALAPAASSPRQALTRCRLGVKLSGLLPVIVQGNYVPNFPPEPRCKLTPKCPVKWLHNLHIWEAAAGTRLRAGCFALRPSPPHSVFSRFYYQLSPTPRLSQGLIAGSMGSAAL